MTDVGLEIEADLAVEAQCEGVRIECVVGSLAGQDGLDLMVSLVGLEQVSGDSVGARDPAPWKSDNRRRLRPAGTFPDEREGFPESWVIHLEDALGAEQAEAAMAICYHDAIQLAERSAARGIGFPALRPGTMDRSQRTAALIAMRAVEEEIPFLENVKLIRFVAASAPTREVYAEAMVKVFGESGGEGSVR